MSRMTRSNDSITAHLGAREQSLRTLYVPAMPGRGPSGSTETCRDRLLRINRGKDYIAVLEKVR